MARQRYAATTLMLTIVNGTREIGASERFVMLLQNKHDWLNAMLACDALDAAERETVGAFHATFYSQPHVIKRGADYT